MPATRSSATTGPRGQAGRRQPAALVEALSAPRVVWVMVPSGEPTRATVKELAGLLSPGDVIVDGGNSKYTDDQVHDVMCREKNIGYVDAGVSGGVWGWRTATR